jgi:hypothetical protein
MMKKILCLLTAFVVFSTLLKAQDETAPEERGFNRNRIFLGTSLNLGLSNRYFNIGLNPEIGYSLNNWLDVGFAFNVNQYSQSASDFDNIKYSNFNYGGGAFLRVWPLPFLHLQIQPEQNWINSTRTNTATNETFKYKLNASSLLAGIGYGSREIGSRFSHFTIMIDLNQAFSSPYRDQFGDPQPVFRGGFGVYLNAKKK